MQDIITPSKVVPLKPPTASELRSRLLGALPSILHYLLPAGVLRGGKFMVGNVQGDKGDSLVVEMNGAKAGLWHDFATSAGGDIIDLWAIVKGFDRQTQFPALLQDIQTHLGAGIDTRPYKPPLPEPQGQNRKLGKPTAKWDYTDAHGNIIASVYRYDSYGRKEFRPWDAVRGVMRAPDIRPLYNQVGLKDAVLVVLVEGEKCAQALITKGLCATTAMNGAKAPVNKTDWSPLQGKHVIIWPDHDEPGLEYARRAASAAARAGAVQVEILKIPLEKPPKWDAADAVEEGLDIEDILLRWERVAVKEPPAKRTSIPMYSITELQADKSPIPDDLIAPRVLTPGGTLVFGGAPKVGKSDFLISLLTHMAAGVTFLGMSPKCPLKIFYLQAEIQYDYLRERVNNVHIVREYASKLHNNFVITPQISVTLDDNGVECVAQSVKERFGSTLPDIIVIDPLRNVFDGGGCPECDHFQPLRFTQLRWPENEPQKAEYVCESCGCLIAEHHKTAMLALGEWRATAETTDGTIGYHLSSLYSPIGWFSWGDAAAMFEDAKRNPDLMKGFVNTVLGEPYEESSDAPEWQRLYERRQTYVQGVVPMGGLFLTAGVDVQKDRIECEIVAWGRNKENWSVDYVILDGDTARPEIWKRLDEEVLQRDWPHATGHTMPIRVMAVDSGYATQDVYGFVRNHPQAVWGGNGARASQPRTVVAVKGRDTETALILSVSKADTGGKRRGLRVWNVSGPVAKMELYRWLKLEWPTDREIAEGAVFPPGSCHFPQYGEEYFKQLTAERRVIRVVKGFPHATWEKDPSRNNEALDCRVYARAAATIYGIDRMSEFKWRSLEETLGVEAVIPTRGVEIPVTEETRAEPPKPQPKKRITVPQRRAVRASDPYL